MKTFALVFFGLVSSFCGHHSFDSVSEAATGVFGDQTEQINKTVTLNPGANVSVSGINGFVKVETSDGNSAEINILIKAADQRTIDCKPMTVVNTPDSLIIKSEYIKECKQPWGRIRHEVTLKLPRQINMKVSGVNGEVTIGQITGEIALSGINGKVTAAQAGFATNISGINGGVSVALMKINAQGLKVSGINGGVDIFVPVDINADVDIRGINGGIDTDLPVNVRGEITRGQMIGTLGSGGNKISVSGINGGVRLKRS